MPEKKPITLADIAAGSLADVHPRLNREVILLPNDVLEGVGDFLEVDGDGNPKGGRLGEPDSPDARGVYVGSTPSSTTKQNTSDIPYEQNSFLFSQLIAEGDPPPSPLLAAKIPKPPTPVVKKEKRTKAGYAASTAQSPHWVAFTFARPAGSVSLRRGLSHTLIGPATSFELLHGQTASVELPTDVPEGTTHIGVWMPEPGTSTAVTPGRMRLQREVDLARHRLSTYELTGPYRDTGRLAPTFDETTFPKPAAPAFLFDSGRLPCRVGTFTALVTFAVGTEQTSQGWTTAPVTVAASPYYGTEEPAGYGHLVIERPDPPPGVTGWYAYLFLGNSYYRVYDKLTGTGRVRPLPLQRKRIITGGWEGGEAYAEQFRYLVVSQDPPDSDETVLLSPDSAPEDPVAVGASFPEGGIKYVRATDSVRGVESVPSDAVKVNLGSDEMMRVVFPNPVNAVANGDHAERDPDDLPTDHELLVTTGGFVHVEDGDLVLETNGAQTGPTPEYPTARATVDPKKPGLAEAYFAVEDPATGTFAGSLLTVLQQISAAGVVTNTTLHTATAAGEFDVSVPIAPAGTAGAALAWRSDTIAARIIHRMSGATKNLKARVTRKGLKDHEYRHRRRKKYPNRPADPRARGGKAPHGGGAAIESPPPPAPPPQAFVYPRPDRPESAGALLIPEENLNAGIPVGYTVSTTGGATIAVDPVAELGGVAGGMGLLIKDLDSTRQGSALLGRSFAKPEGRHDVGRESLIRFPGLPANGYVELNTIRRASDGRALAWLQFGSASEQTVLEITARPTAPGSVGVTLEGARTNIAVAAARERLTLNVTGAPLDGGLVSITTGVGTTNVPVGGVREIARLQIDEPAPSGGTVGVSLNGVGYVIRTIRGGDTAAEVAAKIRNVSYPGWTTGGTGSVVIFSSNLVGPRTNAVYNNGTSNVQGRMSTLQEGSTETAASLATRIRTGSYPGYVASAGPTATEIVFEAVNAGPQDDPVFSPGGTGTTASIVVNTQGSSDTTAELAAKIRATAFAGWTAAQGDAPHKVIFTATTGGDRQAAQYDPAATGAQGTMRTLRQGTAADLTAHVREDDGRITERKIMASLAATDVWTIDRAVSGAGVSGGEAIASFWGSINGGARRLLARFENLDLEQSAVGVVEEGVAFKSSPSVTYEMHVDLPRTTNRGRTYFRDHNARGRLINQVHAFYLPTQPVRDDLLLQGFRFAVLPGGRYTVSAFERHDGLRSIMRPLTVTAYAPEGAAVPVIGTQPEIAISGKGGWVEVSRTFTVPPGCYEAEINSRSVAGGELVLQELVVSPGDVAKRSGGYATTGSYAVSLPLGTPNPHPSARIDRQRRALGVSLDAPVGTSASASYAASSERFAAPEGPFSDSDAVPQYDFVRVSVSMNGDGTKTPVLRADNPRAEYVLLVGSRPVATLLKHDRSELPGGAVFQTLEDSAEIPEVVVRRLPGGRLYRQRMFDPVGQVPAGVLQVFTAEAARYLMERAMLELFVLEAWGEILTLRFSGPFEFKRETQKTQSGHALYVGRFPYSEIVERRVLP